MKKNSFLLKTLTLVFFASLIIAGCKKENSDKLSDAEEEQAANFSTESENENEIVFNDVFDNVMGADVDAGIGGGTGVFGRTTTSQLPGGENTGRELNVDSIPACLVVTKTHLNANSNEPFPLKVVLNFGTGCLCNDGHTRSGKIIIVYDGRLIIPGKSATTTFDGFKFDSLSVEGTHKITNTGTTAQHQFTVDVTDAKLTKPSGNYVQWTSHRVVTQTEGSVSTTPLDDIFSITGSAHGRVKRGNLLFAWQSLITEPLRKKFICHWISKGVLKVWRETLPNTSPWVAVLNYGNGDCDFLATLTINGTVHQIQLPH